jgi:hypothetical protein
MPLHKTLWGYVVDGMNGNLFEEGQAYRNRSSQDYRGISLDEDQWEHGQQAQINRGTRESVRTVGDAWEAANDWCDLHIPGSPSSWGNTESYKQ